MHRETVLFVSLPADIWNRLFGWLPQTPSGCETATCPAPLSGVGFYLLVAASVLAVYLYQADSTPRDTPAESPDKGVDDPSQSESDGQPATGSSAPTEGVPRQLRQFGDDTIETAPAGGLPAPDNPSDEVERLHQQAVAPLDIDESYRSVQTGDTHRRVFFAEPQDFSDVIAPGALQNVFQNPDLKFDLTLQIRPKDRREAKSDAKMRKEGLEAVQSGVFDSDEDEEATKETSEEIERLRAYRDAISNGERPAEMSLWVAARAQDEEALSRQADKLKDTFWREPADIGLETAVGRQEEALQALAPDGRNPLDFYDRFSTQVLGRGVGALFSSLSRSTLIEADGIEWGSHAFNNSPIIKHPFQSETNYNHTWIGDSGAGKSLNTKLNALRTREATEDTMLIFLDPLEGLTGVAKALGAKWITVGGSRGLNPLEIRQPPEHKQDRVTGEDKDPLSAKIDEVMGMFDTYANIENVELDDERFFLQDAVRTAYEWNGITSDPATHHRESPTLQTVFEVLDDMEQNPGEYAVMAQDADIDDVAEAARDLATFLRPFREGGQYENLAQPSEFDLQNEDIIYLDLSQQEQAGGTSLMMQLLFSMVYERAKETPKNVIFVIDEAQKIMKNSTSLAWLGQRIRHARHFDTSVRFVTQDVNDFFQHPHSEAIINNSAFTVLHKISEIDEWADQLGLNDQMVQFVKNANTGEGGYSNALYQFNDRWVPARIEPLEGELAVADFDADEDSLDNLPGAQEAQQSAFAEELHRKLRDGDHEATRIVDESEPLPGEFPGADGQLTDEQDALLDLLSVEEAYEVLERAEDADQHPDEVIANAVVEKLREMDRVLDFDIDADPEGVHQTFGTHTEEPTV